MTITRKAVAEFLGTAFLLAAIVGSGIMGERLSGGNTALALLANSMATGAALFVLIQIFGPISGAHFNPVVTMAMAFQGRMSWRDVPVYALTQLSGAYVGVGCGNIMFGLPLFTLSDRMRGGPALMFSESIATFGLVLAIAAAMEFRISTVPFVVAAYITSAYWFTSSTSFANPAVTLARAMTNTFTGIRFQDVPGFIIGQLIGVAMAIPLWTWLREPAKKPSMKRIIELKKRVLFLCTGNSARSQMAEGILRHLAGEKYEVYSAGTNPKGLHPGSVEAMKEIGIDVSRHTSKSLDEFIGQSFDYVITVCDRAKQQCPVFPGAAPMHWGFDDPAEADAEEQIIVFRRVREEISQRIRLFLSSNRD
jgi:thioredoxin type arsenate reductase